MKFPKNSHIAQEFPTHLHVVGVGDNVIRAASLGDQLQREDIRAMRGRTTTGPFSRRGTDGAGRYGRAAIYPSKGIKGESAHDRK